jgi:hypothetical protein
MVKVYPPPVLQAKIKARSCRALDVKKLLLVSQAGNIKQREVSLVPLRVFAIIVLELRNMDLRGG